VLTGVLYPQQVNAEAKKIAAVKAIGQTAMVTSVSIASGVSLATFSPSSLFTFLNAAEIYLYVAFYNIDLDGSLVAFMNQLQVISMIPNPFSYLIESNQGVQLQGNLKNLGYDSNLILLNSGIKISCMVLSLMVFFIAYLLSLINIKLVQNPSSKFLKGFKYNFFLRYYLQTVFELLFNSLIGILYTKLENLVQIFDFAICCIIIVKYK
jgi:hypothetical protein